MKTDDAVEEKEEAAPPEDDGWMEVGKRNRTVITRTVSCFFSFFLSITERI
jgi:ubiquitin carboxyl-terminal hydrolase 10